MSDKCDMCGGQQAELRIVYETGNPDPVEKGTYCATCWAMIQTEWGAAKRRSRAHKGMYGSGLARWQERARRKRFGIFVRAGRESPP